MSKREYFYGFKTAAAAVHVVTTKEGIPMEFLVTSGSIHDNTSFQGMFMDLPENSDLYADAAYLNEEQRELLLTFNKIKLKAPTKKNSVTKNTWAEQLENKYYRKTPGRRCDRKYFCRYNSKIS